MGSWMVRKQLKLVFKGCKVTDTEVLEALNLDTSYLIVSDLHFFNIEFIYFIPLQKENSRS
jgi:hypothetical protein